MKGMEPEQILMVRQKKRTRMATVEDLASCHGKKNLQSNYGQLVELIKGALIRFLE